MSSIVSENVAVVVPVEVEVEKPKKLRAPEERLKLFQFAQFSNLASEFDASNPEVAARIRELMMGYVNMGVDEYQLYLSNMTSKGTMITLRRDMKNSTKPVKAKKVKEPKEKKVKEPKEKKVKEPKEPKAKKEKKPKKEKTVVEDSDAKAEEEVVNGAAEAVPDAVEAVPPAAEAEPPVDNGAAEADNDAAEAEPKAPKEKKVRKPKKEATA
jgi:hypothetical protein